MIHVDMKKKGNGVNDEKTTSNLRELKNDPKQSIQGSNSDIQPSDEPHTIQQSSKWLEIKVNNQ